MQKNALEYYNFHKLYIYIDLSIMYILKFSKLYNKMYFCIYVI